MTKEIWKTIPGYEGFYEASDRGRIRSVDRIVRKVSKKGNEFYAPRRGQILIPGECRGYLIVNLSKYGKPKMQRVQRLVVSAFLGLGDEDTNHKNGDKKDNRLCNLENATKSQNQQHAVAIGLKKQAIKIVGVNITNGEKLAFNSIAEAAFTLAGGRNSGSRISAAVRGERKHAYGYTWSAA